MAAAIVVYEASRRFPSDEGVKNFPLDACVVPNHPAMGLHGHGTYWEPVLSRFSRSCTMGPPRPRRGTASCPIELTDPRSEPLAWSTAEAAAEVDRSLIQLAMSRTLRERLRAGVAMARLAARFRGEEPPSVVDPEALLLELTRAGVEFIVVGGTAAVLHGSPITTQDLDIVHRRSPENIARLLELLIRLDAVMRYDLANRQLRPTAEILAARGQINLSTTLGPLDPLCELGEGQGYDELLPHSSHSASASVASPHFIVGVYPQNSPQGQGYSGHPPRRSHVSSSTPAWAVATE